MLRPACSSKHGLLLQGADLSTGHAQRQAQSCNQDSHQELALVLQGADSTEQGRHCKPNTASCTQFKILACCCRVLTS